MHIIQSPYFLSDIQNKVPSLAAKDWEILQLIFYSLAPPPFFFFIKILPLPTILANESSFKIFEQNRFISSLAEREPCFWN